MVNGSDDPMPKRAAADLAQLQTALPGSPVILAAQDAALRYRWVCNPPPGAPADCTGLTDAQLLPAAAVALLAPLKQAVLASGQPWRGDVRIDWPCGAAHYDLSLRPLYDSAGRSAGLATTAVDISRFQRSNSRNPPPQPHDGTAGYRAALAAGRLGSWQTDLVAGTRQWSPEGMALFGLDLPDGRGKVGGDDDEYQRALHPDDRHLVARFHSLADQQDSFMSDYRVVHPDGRLLWLSGRGQVVARLPDGRAHRLVSIVADISERKLAEEGLRIERERLALVLKSGRMGVFDSDLAQGTLWWSEQTYRVFGVDPQHFQPSASSVAALIHPDDRAGFLQRRQQAIAQRQPIEHEFRVLHADGRSVWIDYHGQTDYTADGCARRHFGVAVDITARKLAELALHEADRRKDDFIAVLAHELRNPLAPIRHALSLLRLPGIDSAQRDWCRDVMDRQLTQMTRLLEDLLDVSRMARRPFTLRLERLDIASAIRRAVELAQPLLDGARHQFSLTLPPQPLVVHGDTARLTQALSNLIVNAAKYTPPGGHIAVDAAQHGPLVEIHVNDDGIGLSAEQIPQVFEMFNQVNGASDHAQGGLGIGLALARGLVLMHGGTLVARSAGLGQGSTFTVGLPLAAPAALPEPAPAEPLASPQFLVPPSARRRVVVADDLRDAAESLAQVLRAMGHEVFLAFDGAQALMLAERHRPEVVLLDLGMPALDGVEACRRIRAQPWGRSMLLIAQTGWGQPHDRKRTREAGFDHHLVKPIDLDLLGQLLEPVPAQARSG